MFHIAGTKPVNHYAVSARGREIVMIAVEPRNSPKSKSGPGNQAAERERRPNSGDLSIARA